MLSVIIPVYQAEQVLEKCIDSVLAQSFQDLEIILVDDGSTDRSGVICDNYAKQDSRIKVIHKKNAGVSAARNSGLSLASGEYIAFVDSDDYLEPNMYQSMMDKMLKYNCDVVMCDCIKDFSDYSEVYTHNIIADDFPNWNREPLHGIVAFLYDVSFDVYWSSPKYPTGQVDWLLLSIGIGGCFAHRTRWR